MWPYSFHAKIHFWRFWIYITEVVFTKDTVFSKQMKEMKNCTSNMWQHYTHGHHNLNKRISILPEHTFTQVLSFQVNRFLRKKKLLCFPMLKFTPPQPWPYSTPRDHGFRNVISHYLSILPQKFQLFWQISYFEEYFSRFVYLFPC